MTRFFEYTLPAIIGSIIGLILGIALHAVLLYGVYSWLGPIGAGVWLILCIIQATVNFSNK